MQPVKIHLELQGFHAGAGKQGQTELMYKPRSPTVRVIYQPGAKEAAAASNIQTTIQMFSVLLI